MVERRLPKPQVTSSNLAFRSGELSCSPFLYMQKTRLLILAGAIATALLSACKKEVAEIPEGMSLEEKVGMLFFVRPESLMPELEWEKAADLEPYAIQELCPSMEETAERCFPGGIILYAHNIGYPQQLKRFVRDLRALPGNPIICIDEEGGRVARIANNPEFHLRNTVSTADIKSDISAYRTGKRIGKYLSSYGISFDFAPVADVNTNPENIIIGKRAFSDSPRVAAGRVKAFVKGMQRSGVAACIKHFPGHGDTYADTHLGYAVSHKSWEEMLGCEIIPFKAGIRAGVKTVMVAHISAPKVTSNEDPCTLSHLMVSEKLRGELGFKGVVVTDAMEMGAIVQNYPADEAVLRAIEAGCDIILGVKDFPAACQAVLDAVKSGRLSESRIDESVRRILTLR